ncbi:PAAR domain-containing protein [bacterium]|nr:PAAR domain-containing protein [bacterium]RQV96050.1 MAG: hypothetical protein EH221_05280 [bacterium]
MRLTTSFIISVFIIFCIKSTYSGEPAARLGDTTAHGGSITAGESSVLIGGMPAARKGDMHICPMVTPTVPPHPHIGGPIANGSSTVFIGGMPAARVGDMATCSNGPPDEILTGYATVLIGDQYTQEDQSHDAETDEGIIPAKAESESRLTSPQVIEAPSVLKSTASGQQIISPISTPQADDVLEVDKEQKIITSKGITIESTASEVEILAGTSRIVMDASGKITIESSQIELRSTGDLNLKGTNITISADVETKIEGTRVISQASFENQVKGTQVTVEGSSVNTIRGSLVRIN